MADGLNIKEVKGIIRRRIKIFLLIFVPILIVSFIVASILPPIYVSKSTIVVEAQQIPEEYVRATVTSYVEERLQLITQRILRREKLLEIIRKFNLYPDMMGKYATEVILEKMRKDITFETVSTGELSGRRSRPTTVAFSLSYEGKDPVTVQKVASVLASLYLEENFRKREQQATSTTIFLQQELDRIRTQVNEYADKISAFKKEHAGELPEHTTINMQALERLNRDFDQANMQIQSLRERKTYLEGQLASLDAFQPQQATEAREGAIMTPEERLRSLRSELTKLQFSLSEKHPDIRKLKREISELEIQIRETPSETKKTDRNEETVNPAYISIKTQIDTTDIEINNLLTQRTRIKKEMTDYQKKIERAPLVERDYNNLTQDYANAQRKANEMMDKLMEATVAKGMEETQFGERFTIIDPAQIPEKPEKPDRRKIMLMGLFLSLGAGMGLAMTQESLDHSIKTVAELDSLSNVPTLSVIPLMKDVKENRRRRRRYIIWSLIIFCVICCGSLILIHLFMIPLDILWVRIQQKLIILWAQLYQKLNILWMQFQQ